MLENVAAIWSRDGERESFKREKRCRDRERASERVNDADKQRDEKSSSCWKKPTGHGFINAQLSDENIFEEFSTLGRTVENAIAFDSYFGRWECFLRSFRGILFIHDRTHISTQPKWPSSIYVSAKKQ